MDNIIYDEDTIELQELFATREAMYSDITQDIVDLIGPTVLEALYRLIDVPTDAIRWLDFKSTDNLVIVMCGVTYNPSVTVPKFITDTALEVIYSPTPVEQTVRIGIPYEMVLAAPEDILAFLQALVVSHKSGGPSLIEHLDIETLLDESPNEETHSHRVDDVFDPTNLSTIQKQQLLFFQHETKDKLH
jgi:hypothetical protein